MRNRKMITQSQFETIIDIDALINSACSDFAELPAEILVHIFSFCDAQTMIALSQTNWLFFAVVVSMNPKQFKLMSLYHRQLDLLNKHDAIMFFMVHKDFRQFLQVSKIDIPILIQQLESGGKRELVSSLKVLNFMSTIRNINHELTEYEYIDKTEWRGHVNAIQCGILFFKAGSYFTTVLMVCELQSKLLIGLATAVALIMFTKDMVELVNGQKLHWEKRHKLHTKIAHQFSLFKNANKKPGELEKGVLLGIR
jgi:hypothetical protein